VTPVRLVVHSDYLCPWCYNASVRLRRLEREFDGEVEVEWRAYLLRPRPRAETGDADRTLEKFVRYTQSWMRAAAEPEAGRFRVWETTEGPPSWSMPPHVVAKAAARHGRAAFGRVHERLLDAYFGENRDITAAENVAAIWADADLPADELPKSDDEALVAAVWGEYREAVERGMTGVPAVHVAGQDPFLIGAQPYELYERWVTRQLEARVADG
jgi:predicted DsbA family dithiol-disulfide isomerase